LAAFDDRNTGDDMARTRTFIAVEVGEAICDRATALQEALAKTGAAVKWVTPESMHVTLLFLGDVDDRELPAVCRAVQEVAAGELPFTVHVAGVGAFPNLRRPKTVWAAITEGAEPLRRLYDALETRMLGLGVYRKEERGYTPHLTLGRVRGETDGNLLVPEIAKRQEWDAGQSQVTEVLVFSSELERDGPVYTVLGRGELGGRE
jgi:2'-5' RNA ligase